MEWEASHGESAGSSIEGKISKNGFNVLNELRKTGQLTDAVIKAESRMFPVHRNIMSACSSYFRALFTNDMFNTDRRNVMIPGVSAAIMEIIIDYAYTRHVEVTYENVEILLPAADQFHVNGIVKACCQYLVDHLCAENCIGIYKFAAAFFCHNLEKTSYRFIMQNFSEVYMHSHEFIQLGIDELFNILSSDDLNVKNEEIVFDAVLRWIDYDPDRRKIHIAQLLRSIRLGLLTTQYFVEKVKPHQYVKEINACKPIIIETLKFLYDLDMDEDKEVDISNPIAKPRVPHEILFVVGGWSGGSPTNIVETYDTRADRWIVSDALDTDVGLPGYFVVGIPKPRINSLSQAVDTRFGKKTDDIWPRAYHGIAALDHLIYIVGGFDGVEYYNSVRCFNPVSETWSEVAPMNAKRCYVSVAVLNGLVYAMGGFDGHNRQNTAERYQARSNQWSLIQPMNHQRSDASATSHNGRIYICGGFNGQECLHTAEYYDPSVNQWTLVAPMRNRRSGVGVTAYRDHVYAIGGFNGVTRVGTGEKFNPSTNTWQTIPEMYNPRSNFAIEVIDDMVFAIGGFNGVTTIFNVECYDGATDEWLDATDMNLYRSALGACVVAGLPNVQDYIHKYREKEVLGPKQKRNPHTNK